MQGKICLITGATSGIGEATALSLASMGATVVLHGRSVKRINETRAMIQSATGQSVDHLQADLSSLQAVRGMVTEFQQRYNRLDVLINNAGAVFMRRQLSKDGIEMTFAVNHLSHFVLTLLLIESLIAAGNSRIINVSSGLHHRAIFEEGNFPLNKGYTGIKAYAQSKLANVVFTYGLAQRLEHHSLTVNALSPGGVRTRIGFNNGFLMRWLMQFAGRTWKSADDGARTSVFLATDVQVEGLSGKFFENSKETPSSAYSHNSQAGQWLWDVSMRLSGLKETELPYLPAR